MAELVNGCQDCGQPCKGPRCAKDRGLFLQRRSLLETAEEDAKLLKMVREENLSYNRVATRYGVSPTRARHKVLNAQRREAKRAELGIVV